MLAGHRWEYKYYLCWYECVPLPFGGVESYVWCVGCGCIITDEELCSKHFPSEHPFIDLLASTKGCNPIEAGTIEEWKLHKRKGDLR